MRATLLPLLLATSALAASPAADGGTTVDGGQSQAGRFRWQVPQVVQEIEVPALMETNGIPNRFHVVLSSMDARSLHAHFLRAFQEADLHVPPPNEQMKLDGQVMLTGFDPETETSYSVILQPYASGNTTVIMGEAYFAGRTLSPSNAFAPVFPGAERLVTQNLEGAENMSYSVTAAPEEVVAFYRELLPESGYTAEENGAFTRGDETIQILARKVQGQPWTEVVLLRTVTPR